MQGSVNTCNSVHLKTQLIDGYVIVQTKNRQIQVKSTFHLGLFVGPVHNVGANHRLLKSTHTHTYKSTHIFYVIHTLKLWLWPTEKAAILSYFHMQTQHRHTHSNHNTWSNNRQWQHSPREFIHITRTTSTDEGFSFYPNKWQKPRKKDQYTEKQRSHLSSSQYRQTTAQKLTTVYIYICCHVNQAASRPRVMATTPQQMLNSRHGDGDATQWDRNRSHLLEMCCNLVRAHYLLEQCHRHITTFQSNVSSTPTPQVHHKSLE